MRFFKLLITLCIPITIFSCKSADPGNCKKFRNGKFYIGKENEKDNYTIVRHDSIQIETEKSTGNISEWKIKWITDCKYDLLLLKDNFNFQAKQNTPYSATFEIITATERYYVFKREFDLFSAGLIDTIWKAD